MMFLSETTPWEIIEIYSQNNAIYCLQVREDKKKGTKDYKSCKIVETKTPVSFKNITVEKINELTKTADGSTRKELKNKTA